MNAISYCTLYKIGHWSWLDAKCEFEPETSDGPGTHRVDFVLCGIGRRERCLIGTSRIHEMGGQFYSDEFDQQYPDLNAAIRAEADYWLHREIVAINRGALPPSHTYDTETVTAF